MARAEHQAAMVGQWLLAAAIVAAPLAAGGFRLWVLYGLGAIVSLAYGATIHSARRLHVTALTVVLAGLAAFTALQAMPLSPGLLEFVSPRAHEVRTFISEDGGPISYEVGATWRETAKLVMYAMIAVVAFERARSTRGMGVVCRPLIVAAITTAAIAIVHRALGIERLFGLIEARGGSTSQMLTTFVNPNHAAGFMGMAALTAVGLALDEKQRPQRVGLLGLAGVFGAVSVLVLSKGGVVALLIGLALFASLVLLKRKSIDGPDIDKKTPALLATALVLPLLGLAWRWKAVLADFGLGEGRVTLGIDEKLAAVRDAVPMALDHLWFGIGRGAYVSVYTAYKTSALQLTFVFPENLAAQLASEWGVVVGGAALVGLFVALVARLRRATSWTAVGALSGVAVVVVQNAVDFSLEMPGVAIPVVAILAAAGAGSVKSKRIEVTPPLGYGFWAVAPIVTFVAALLLARANGDLFEDLASLGSPHPIAAETLLERHPSNALVAARLAYLAETDDPPRYNDAIRLVNRAMYFAPTYADGHLLAGRLLIRGGHRRQGFGELRRAWTLAPSARGQWIDHVIELANDADEVIRALPRRDEGLDVIDEQEAARVVSRLVVKKRKAWAFSVIDALGPVDRLDPESLTIVAVAATKTGSTSYARAALTRRLETDDDESARLALVRLLVTDGDYDQARETIEDIVLSDDNAEAVLRLRIRIAMVTEDYAAARDAVTELERRTPPTISNTAKIAELLASVERKAGETGKAIAALDRGLEKDPGNARLRWMRAVLLFERGRHAEARVDAEFVLRRQPDHRAAKALVARIRGTGSP